MKSDEEQNSLVDLVRLVGRTKTAFKTATVKHSAFLAWR